MQKEHLEYAQNICLSFENFFKGVNASVKNQEEQNSLFPKLIGEQTMKYKGITIKKRPNCNTWYARYRHNGQQFSVSAKTQKECYDKLKICLRKLNNEKLSEDNLTFKTWYDTWLKTYKSGKVKVTTIEDYTASLKYLTNIFNLPLDKINDLIIHQTLNKIQFERRKQKVYELLKDIFNKAYLNNLIKKNIISTIDKPTHIRINGAALSLEDQIKLENCTDQKYTLFKFCMFQGLRKGELLGLTIADIDLKNKTIEINKSFNENNEIDTTKNQSSIRKMPLFDKSLALLKNLDNKKTDRLFNFSARGAQKLWSKLCNLLKFTNKYTIHSLRHTFITNCQEKQIPMHIIQKWVGHTIGSKVTNTVYTHARDNAEKKAIEILNDFS